MRKISRLFGGLILVIGVASCGGGGNCPAGTICMGSANFFTSASTTQPVTLTVAANTAVTWTNDSGTQHDVIFDDPSTALAVGAGDPGNIPLHTSGSNQRQFTTTGHHPFHCSVHGTTTTGMRGDVVVQ